jgi:hypothetical protein
MRDIVGVRFRARGKKSKKGGYESFMFMQNHQKCCHIFQMPLFKKDGSANSATNLKSVLRFIKGVRQVLTFFFG